MFVGNDFMNEIEAATSAAMALSGQDMPKKEIEYPVKTIGNDIGLYSA